MRKTFLDKSETGTRAQKPCLGVLWTMPEDFAKKLKTVIEHDHPHFILTGSDPRMEHGCCPSNQVGAANRLVEAGILQSCAPWCDPGGCSATVYAFAGEIVTGADKPEFRINGELRQEVLRYLEYIRSPRPILTLRLLRWVLLGFAASATAFVIFEQTKQFVGRGASVRLGSSQGLAENLREKTGVAVCYFYGADKCDFCDEMKAYTKKALNIHFPDRLQTRELAFIEVDWEEPTNRELKKEYGLFTSTILFIEFENGQKRRVKLVQEAWNPGLSEDEFVEMMRDALGCFLETKDG